MTEQGAQAKARGLISQFLKRKTEQGVVTANLSAFKEFEGEVAKALLEAYRQGEESMRSRAVKVAESNAFAPDTAWGQGARHNANKIARRIRALAPEERSQGDHADGGGDGR